MFFPRTQRSIASSVIEPGPATFRSLARCSSTDLSMTFKFEVAKFGYDSLNNKTPNSFRKYLYKINDRLSRATRQSADCNNLHIPGYGANKYKRIRESRFGIAFPQILAHFAQKIQILLQKHSTILVQILASKIFVHVVCMIFFMTSAYFCFSDMKRFMLMMGCHFLKWSKCCYLLRQSNENQQ